MGKVRVTGKIRYTAVIRIDEPRTAFVNTIVDEDEIDDHIEDYILDRYVYDVDWEDGEPDVDTSGLVYTPLTEDDEEEYERYRNEQLMRDIGAPKLLEVD